MTEQELAAIEKRCNAATDGPWVRDGSKLEGTTPGTMHDIALLVPAPIHLNPVDQCPFISNGDFIAASRTDVPALLAWGREGWAEVRRLRAVLKKVYDEVPWDDAPTCKKCGMGKQPHGRDCSGASAGDYCTDRCPGHHEEPHPLSWWPGERREGRRNELEGDD